MSSNPNVRPVILILTGNLGDGHRQAAYALAEEALLLHPGAEAPVVDIMERTHPLTHRFSRFLYMQWITKMPWLYGALFRMTKDDTRMARVFKRFRLVPLKPLARLIEEVNPSVVVSTFPSAAAAMSQLKDRSGLKIPAVTVITDHTYHSYWVHPGTDRYIVGSDRIRQALHRLGVPDRAVSVTGIPIRSAFHEPKDRGELRRKLGLDPELPTLMIMGGGCGLIGGDWGRLLRDPSLAARPMQTVIVCGRNERLQHRLRKELAGHSHPIRITGYVDNVQEWMGASDLLVTKPGGLTTSEALASRLPMLLYKPLPGQEYDNAEYLTRMGAAVQAADDRAFTAALCRLLDDPEELRRMARQAASIAGSHSAELAVRELLGTGPADPGARPLQRRARIAQA